MHICHELQVLQANLASYKSFMDKFAKKGKKYLITLDVHVSQMDNF